MDKGGDKILGDIMADIMDDNKEGIMAAKLVGIMVDTVAGINAKIDCTLVVPIKMVYFVVLCCLREIFHHMFNDHVNSQL